MQFLGDDIDQLLRVNLIYSLKGHFQGQKGQPWSIVTYFSILFSNTEGLPNCIVSGNLL